MLRQIGLGALLLAAVALMACSGGGGAASKPAGGGGAASKPGGAGSTVTVKGTDAMRFDPANLTLPANAPVTITLDDTGTALVHDLTIDNIGGQRFQVKAQPNGRASGQLTPAAGTYQFYCSEPGHREAGMVGTLTVS